MIPSTPGSTTPPSDLDGARRIVVVGGVAGGMSAAARARRLDERASIIVLEQSDHVSFAGCGLPYQLSGEIADRDTLLLHTPASLRASLDLDVRTRHRVTAVDRAARTVTVAAQGGTYELGYDALLLAPGATTVLPPVTGLDHPAVHTLRTIGDLDALTGRLAELEAEVADGRTAPVRAVVVGAGFIGLEAVEALVGRGLTVDVVERADQVLPPLEPDLAPLLADELRDHGVGLHLGTSASAVVPLPAGADHAVALELTDGTALDADVVLVSVGVRPASDLAAAAGLALGERGAIRVDGDQRTSDPHVWAVGDAVEVVHAVTGATGPVPLAGPANRQGRRAADAMTGHRTTPQAPVLGTAIVRVFGLTAAVTGPSHATLAAADVAHEQVRVHAAHHAGWFPGAEPVHVTASFAPDGRLLGAQAVGRAGWTSASTCSRPRCAPGSRPTTSRSSSSRTPRPTAPPGRRQHAGVRRAERARRHHAAVARGRPRRGRRDVARARRPVARRARRRPPRRRPQRAAHRAARAARRGARRRGGAPRRRALRERRAVVPRHPCPARRRARRATSPAAGSP